MENVHDYCMVITTCDGKDASEKILRPLLADKLAACIQVFPIRSYYTWKGSVHEDDEMILLIKALSANYEAIEETIRRNHGYEVPEIIQVPITAGFAGYLNWIKEVSR